MSAPALAIVIPSYNRRRDLDRILQALERQTAPPDAFEVVVVLDGGTDDSPDLLARWQREERLARLSWHRQENSGQAAARNAGARLAKAPAVLFLDDDIVPEPELVATHLRWHETGERLAVLGDCELMREDRDSFYLLDAWGWWEDLYHERAQPGRQPGYRDFCAGNVSLRREDFLTVGGFDEAFRGYGGEDYELGYRLLRAGVRFVADRSARARHYHATTAAGVLRKTRQEAHGDLVLGTKHPELRRGLRLCGSLQGRRGGPARLALRAPAVGDALMSALSWLLPILQRLKLRRRWSLCFATLRTYAYWRGARDAFGSWTALARFRAEATTLPVRQLDISEGLPAALPPLWVDGPSQLVITVRGQPVATLHLDKAVQAPLHPYLAEQLIAQCRGQLWTLLAESGWSPAPPASGTPVVRLVPPPEAARFHKAPDFLDGSRRS